MTDLIIALPQNESKIAFFVNLMNLQGFLSKNKISYMISVEGGSNVSIVRDCCLGIKGNDTILTNHIPPFYGEVDYRYILWIDSDIIYKPEDVLQLMGRDKDIVAGFYKGSPKNYNASMGVSKETGFLNGMSEEDTEGEKLIELASVGLGFMLVKRGVFEKVPRPWFLTTVIDLGAGDRVVAEDVYFCWKARQYGFKVWGDPKVKVAHMKYAFMV
jgi:hypothetical protein